MQTVASGSQRSTSSLGENRVPWVDYAKGICIVLVVMMHTTLNVGSRMGDAGFMDQVVAFAKPFRMPDFFILSGLFLARVIGKNWRSYTDSKVLHFVYFYILWTIIQFLFKAPVAVAKNEYDLLIPFAWTIVEPYETLWFIYILPIFFVVSKLARGVPPVIMLLATAALESSRIHTGWSVLDEFAARYFYFVVGWYAAPLIFRAADYVSRNPGKAMAGLAAWAVVNALSVFGPSLGGMTGPGATPISQLPGISLVLGLAGSFAVIAVASLLERYNLLSFLRYCGQNSIVVYLTFAIPMVLFRAVLQKVPFIQDPALVTLIVLAGAVATPLLFHALIKDTWLRFLYERPDQAKLAPRAKSVPA